MEEILSSNDSEGDADSDEFSKDREEELYSVLHYNDFSQGVPPELLEKYCISTDENNEFVISFKNSTEQYKPGSDRDDGSKPRIEQCEGALKGTVTAKSPSDLSSDDDVVVVELEPTKPKNKVSAGVESRSTQNQKRGSLDAKYESEFSSNLKRNVDGQHKLPPNRASGSKTVSLLTESASNSKKRCREYGAEEKWTLNTDERYSEDAVVAPKLAQNPKKRKSEDNVESTLAPISEGKNFKNIHSEMTPNPKNERNVKGANSKMVPNPKKLKSTENEVGPESYQISKDRCSDDGVESKVPSNPKSRPSNKGTETNSASPLKAATEVVVEEHSDSDDSSCVVVEDPEMNRKISLSSTESVVALLSSEDEASGFSLNTTEDILYDSDGNVSDVIETSQFGWEEVSSPDTWTKEMRKYYNSSCERLRYFDHKKIRQQIKTGSRRDWMISPKDLYPNNRPKQRCLVCRQTDHLARNCPKKDPTCHMCGIQGHSNMDCPNSICLQCGKKNRQFTSVCRSCTYTLSRECFNCKQAGHESKACPEKWREFHSTTEGPLKKDKKHHHGSRILQCCNCGKANHTFEECNQQYMSNFAKSLPAYNWLFGRSGGHEDWRAGFSGVSPRSTFEPPFKRRRYHHGQDSFFDELPRWIPVSPKRKPKNRKRKGRRRN